MILCIFDILYYREAQKYEIIYLETLQGSFRMSLFMDEWEWFLKHCGWKQNT